MAWVRVGTKGRVWLIRLQSKAGMKSTIADTSIRASKWTTLLQDALDGQLAVTFFLQTAEPW